MPRLHLVLFPLIFEKLIHMFLHRRMASQPNSVCFGMNNHQNRTADLGLPGTKDQALLGDGKPLDKLLEWLISSFN